MTTPPSDVDSTSQYKNQPWVTRHPGFVLSIVGVFLILIQWMGTQWLQEIQGPNQKKTESAIQGIRRDIRTMVTHQLEAQRFTRNMLTDLARTHGIEIKLPPQLKEAEDAARKLRNRVN